MPSQPRKQKMSVQTPQGSQIKDCVLVEIVDAKEAPLKYTLEDGSVLTIRHLVQEIWRVEGEYDQENNPMYVIKAANMVNILADPKLKRPVN